MSDILGKGLHLVISLLPLGLLVTLIFVRFKGRKNTTDNAGSMKRISLESGLLRFFGTNRESYFYDAEFLYQIRGEQTLKIPLSDITRGGPTSTKALNRRVWSFHYRLHNTEKRIFFVHNFSLFNQNFASFLTAVQQANPEADIKDASFFTL